MQVTQQDFGISAIGLAIPQLALSLPEFAKTRSITNGIAHDIEKSTTQFTESLGCQTMALCAPGEDVVSLAIKAAQRALHNWSGTLEQIGLVIVATETAVDMSRPLSSWVLASLGLKGNIRSYEVKHACYAGTAAVRQALEWKLSGNSKGKAALVIAADVAMYALGHSGEPTQGAGAVALIIDQPTIAAINPRSYYWSDPQFDFWRPVGNAYPEVNGRLSLVCYVNAALQCFSQLAPQQQLADYLQEYSLYCLHVPFPKMVFKGLKRIGEYCGWDNAEIQNQYQTKVAPTMQWNQQIGNSYTASLWFAVAQALTQLNAKQQFLAFSYGSGCGAELLTLQCSSNQANAKWVQDLNQDFAARTFINSHDYLKIREQL